MKPLIIGEALSEPWFSSGKGASGRPVSPLDGPGGKRIAKLIGISLEEFLDAYDRVNIYGGLAPSRWNRRDASMRAEEIYSSNMLRNVILLGRRVESALIVGAPNPYFARMGTGRRMGSITVVPHPSGLSHWWNDPLNVTRAEAWWRESYERIKS